ncbi:Rnf-Nqr domain containing protein [Pseudomonas sp. TWP3-1]|uniref:Rnf-Nqr domain containing protein n=1 Tax=Pseudomonas sp. TWP3-1 TaxID=2804631 RepID=UPI003CE6B207
MNRSAALSNSMLLVLLLGASGSIASALAILLMFTVVVGLYHLCMKPLRTRLSAASLLLASLLLAATLSSCADILLQRWSLQWHTPVSLYIGLIGLQCVLLEQHGIFSRSASERLSLYGLFVGLMLTLATLRELFGEGLHLLTLAPGAFIVLGLLLAARQTWKRPAALPEETHRP